MWYGSKPLHVGCVCSLQPVWLGSGHSWGLPDCFSYETAPVQPAPATPHCRNRGRAPATSHSSSCLHHSWHCCSADVNPKPAVFQWVRSESTKAAMHGQCKCCVGDRSYLSVIIFYPAIHLSSCVRFQFYLFTFHHSPFHSGCCQLSSLARMHHFWRRLTEVAAGN